MQGIRHHHYNRSPGMHEDTDALWSDAWSWPLAMETAALDMFDEGDELVVRVTLPNYKKDEITVRADTDTLEIRAQHQEREKIDSKRRYFVHESSNEYRRRVGLPRGADAEAMKATFRGNVLTVRMPYDAKKLQAKTIKVE